MDLSLYFDPVTVDSLHIPDEDVWAGQLLHYILLYNPDVSIDIQEADIAIMGVPSSTEKMFFTLRRRASREITARVRFKQGCIIYLRKQVFH